MKKRMKWTGLIVALIMIAASATPVFAQSETDPGVTPTETPNSFLDNPIVQQLAGFFASLFTPEEPTETPPPDEGTPPEDTPDPNGDGGETLPPEEPTATPTPVPSPEEQVAALHTEEKLGFGEMTKLLQIVTEAKLSCVTDGTNCDVTLDSLLSEYKSGTGMGQLFAKYGKPAITGVGQTKKVYDENGNRVKTNNGKANGKNK